MEVAFTVWSECKHSCVAAEEGSPQLIHVVIIAEAAAPIILLLIQFL